MTIYYCLYASLFLFSGIFKGVTDDRDKRNKMLAVYGGVCIFLLLALRHWSMGVDLGYYSMYDTGYIQSFRRLNTYSWREILTLSEYLNYERGYIIFNKLVGSVCEDSQFFLGTCAFISVLPVTIYIYKRSEMPLLSWIIFMALPVFLMFFSGLRQCIAISITMLAVHWIEEKKKISFVITVLIASMFHGSSIIFLVAYPMYYMRPSQLVRMILVACLPIVYVFRGMLFGVFSKIFKDNAVIEDTGAGLLFVIFCAVYIFLIFFDEKMDKRQNGLINLFYVACVCQAFSGVYNTAMRVGYYFMIYLPIILTNTISKFKTETGKPTKEWYISYFVILIAFLLFGLLSISQGSFSKTNPYVLFWTQK